MNSPKQLKCPTINLLLLPHPFSLHLHHAFAAESSLLLPCHPRHSQAIYLEEKVTLVTSRTQAIHLDLPVSVGAISIIAVVVTMFSSANLAAFCLCNSRPSWCSSLTCALKLGRSTVASNACVTCSRGTSIRVTETLSSQLLSCLTLDQFIVGYFPRGGLFDTRFFCAKVGTTAFSFHFGFSLTTIEFKNHYK